MVRQAWGLLGTTAVGRDPPQPRIQAAAHNAIVRSDWGCPTSGTIGFNTSMLSASHPNYTPETVVIGRGIQSVQRLDFLLNPK